MLAATDRREMRDSMCSLLTGLLAALYVDPENLSTGIAEAQGRVRDELVPAAEAGCLWTDPGSADELA